MHAITSQFKNLTTAALMALPLSACGSFRADPEGPGSEIITAYIHHSNPVQQAAGVTGTYTGVIIGIPVGIVLLPITLPIEAIFVDHPPAGCGSIGFNFNAPVVTAPIAFFPLVLSNVIGAVTWPFVGWWHIEETDSKSTPSADSSHPKSEPMHVIRQ